MTIQYGRTGTASATVGVDYTGPLTDDSVAIPGGFNDVFVPFTPVDDAVAEPTETVVVTIQENAAYTIAQGTAESDILDNEPPVVSITAVDADGSETHVNDPTDTATFVVSRDSGDLRPELVVSFDTSAGTATLGDDYTLVDTVGTTITNSVTIFANEPSATITLRPVLDGTIEGEEIAQLDLLPAPSGEGGPAYVLAGSPTGTPTPTPTPTPAPTTTPTTAKATIRDGEVGPDAGQAGTTGDVVPSNKGATGLKHYVSPKKAGGQVVLKANVPAGKTFGDLYKWDGDGEAVAGSPEKRAVSRGTAGRYEVRLLNKANDTVLDRMVVWVVWATGSITQQPGTAFARAPDTTIDGTATTSAVIKLDKKYLFKFTIEPAALFDATNDHPDLTGAPNPNPPGGNSEFTGTALSGGANLKWDMSRRALDHILNPNLIPKGKLSSGFGSLYDGQPKADSNGADFPADDVVGNDDAGFTDEDNNPYAAKAGGDLAHAVGEITSLDNPTIWIPEAGAANGNTFQEEAKFGEFARVNIGSKWYRVSDFLDWNLTAKVKMAGGVWTDNGSATGPGN